MHIISRKKLLEAGKKHGTKLESALDGWCRVAKAAKWRSLEDIRRTYPHADGVSVGKGERKRIYTVFNVGGDDLRLIAEIFFEDQTVLVRHALTHAEYDQESWKK